MSERDQLDEQRDDGKSLLALIPRRTFARVVVLLLLLAAVIFLQRRAGSIVSYLQQTLAAPSRPWQTEPRVRLDPPAPPPQPASGKTP